MDDLTKDENIQAPDQENKDTFTPIASAAHALKMAKALVKNDRERGDKRAVILAAFSGTPPYSDAELKAAGQAHRYNVSFGHLEGVIARATAPYLDLAQDPDILREIEADLPEAQRAILGDELVRIVKEEGSWPKLIERQAQDLVLYGNNALLFPSIDDPFPILGKQGDVLVPEGTPNDASNVEWFVWRKEYLMHELAERIEDEESAKLAGWNIEQVKKAIANAKEIEDDDDNQESSDRVSRLRRSAYCESYIKNRQVRAYHVFAASIRTNEDGKRPVLHYIVADTSEDSAFHSEDSTAIELFKKEEEYESIRDILVYFGLEAGDGTWHGSRGVGNRAYNQHQADDRLKNDILDKAFASGMIIAQPDGTGDINDFELTPVGPFAVLPPGMTFQPKPIAAPAPELFAATNLIATTSEQRIGDVVPSLIGQGKDPRSSATGEKLADQRASRIAKGNLKRFVEPLSLAVRIMLRRLLDPATSNEYATRFQERLKARGLPVDSMELDMQLAYAGRIDTVLGERLEKIQAALNQYRNDRDVNQKELKKRHLSALLGDSELPGLLVVEEDQTVKVEATQDQMVENVAIEAGNNVPVSPREDHATHIEVVIGRIMQLMQTSGAQAMAPINQLGIHATAHLEAMKAQTSNESPQSLTFIPYTTEQVAQYEQALNQMGQQLAQVQASQPAVAQPAQQPV